jgi:hypothetical protein
MGALKLVLAMLAKIPKASTSSITSREGGIGRSCDSSMRKKISCRMENKGLLKVAVKQAFPVQ